MILENPSSATSETKQLTETIYYIDGKESSEEDYDASPLEVRPDNINYSPPDTLYKYTMQSNAYEDILEPKYLIRYVDVEGKIISKDVYEAASEETAFKCAFVGCSYHCG